MSRGLTLLAADDEPLPLEDLAGLLWESPLVDRVEVAHDGREALRLATGDHFDGLFLDVRMPDLDGLELGRILRRFEHAPPLVFVSAYDASAADAFELAAVDYLRKPVSRRRLEEALDRVQTVVGRAPQETASSADEVIAVATTHGATRLIRRDAILYAQAYGDYVRLVSEEGRFLLRATITELELRWLPHGFLRVHRGFVANLRRATEITPQRGGTAELRFGADFAVPIARRHVSELRRRLGA